MKTFKSFLKEETKKKIDKKYEGVRTISYEIPSAVIHQGKHSISKDIPSAVVDQGKHSLVKNNVKEAYDRSLRSIDNEANPHLGSNTDEISEKMHDHYDHESLSSDEKRALSGYTSSSSNLNNTLLDSHRSREAAPPSVNNIRTRHLDSALDKHSLPHAMAVYSGVKFHPDRLASQTPTREIHLPAYTSTSIKPSVTEEFATNQREDDNSGVKHIIKFHLDEGQKGFYIGDHSKLSHENEFILPRHTRIKLGETPDTRFSAKDGTPIHIWDAHIVPHDPDDPHRRVIPDISEPEHFNQLLRPDHSGFETASQNYPEHVESHHITKALEHKDYWVREFAAQHPKATPEHIDKALRDTEQSVRIAGARNPNATRDNIDTALKSEQPSVRLAALRNPNAGKDQITRGLADDKVYHNLSYNLKKGQIDHVMDHRFGNDETHEKAALNLIKNEHGSFDNDHVEKGISHPNPTIRAATYQHFRHMMSPPQLARIRADEHPQVKSVVL